MLLRWEEVDRLGRRDGLYVASFEAEGLHSRHQLAFQLLIVQLAGNDPAVRDLTRRSNRDLEHHFAFQLGAVAQRAAVEGIDRTLVAIEDQLDLFAAACSLGAASAALHTIIRL